MSGIIGIIRMDGQPVERRELVSMADQMPHRGPDGRTFHIQATVGLGHLWLRTSSRSAHNVEIGRNGVYITADARIDNRKKLVITSHISFREPPYRSCRADSCLLTSKVEPLSVNEQPLATVLCAAESVS